MKGLDNGRAIALAMIAGATLAAPARAQDAPAPGATLSQPDEIIVTARRRIETAISTPVTITSIRGVDFERRGLSTLDDIARVTPQLIVGPASGSTQGGSITMRGLTAGETNNFADQSVSFNIDGAQVGRSSVQRLSAFDIEQVDVLKGPQALFYGKNSPGGIISIRTADPTPDFQAKISTGYEFVGNDVKSDGFVSGPITDKLGIRVAMNIDHLDGWLKNVADGRDYPRNREYDGRVTLKYEASPEFTARLKLNYSHLKDTGTTGAAQYVFCGGPVPVRATSAVDCSLNKFTGTAPARDAAAAGDPNFKDGNLYGQGSQALASLELAYSPSSYVALTSLSSYYRSTYGSLSNFSLGDLINNRSDAYQAVKFSEFNQELRIATSFPGMFNTTAGIFFQSSDANYNFDVFFGAPRLFTGEAKQKGTTYSPYAQVIFKPIQTVEISGGVRYSHEEKSILTGNNGVSNLVLTPNGTWTNVSPEATIAYRPNSDLNFFVSYKTGFLSGGFNGGPQIYAGQEISYLPEKIKGVEGGVKARFLNGNVTTSLTYFDYTIRDLQVTAITGVSVFATNAGRAYTRGMEFDGTVRPFHGLTLHGSAAYNKANYQDFLILCYKGQSISQGCNLNNTGANFTRTNLAGQPLLRAPKWSGSGSFDYQADLGSKWLLGVTGGATYSSSYFTTAQDIPASLQKSYWLVDASLRFGPQSERWELAFIGRNLTNKYYFVRASETPGTGAQGGFAAPTRGADLGSAGSRGREAMLRLTLRTGAQ